MTKTTKKTVVAPQPIVRNTTERILLMQEAMLATPQTFEQLAEASGLSKTAVQRWALSIRSHIHIADYAPDKRGRKFVPMFVWGEGEDAPRPGPQKSAAQRMQAVRDRRKAVRNADLF